MDAGEEPQQGSRPDSPDGGATPDEPSRDAHSPPARRVTYDELTTMASILALNPDSDPSRFGWGAEPHRTEWETLRAEILDMKARGIGIDPG